MKVVSELQEVEKKLELEIKEGEKKEIEKKEIEKKLELEIKEIERN